MAIFHRFGRKRYRRTDGRTDQPTDGQSLLKRCEDASKTCLQIGMWKGVPKMYFFLRFSSFSFLCSQHQIIPLSKPCLSFFCRQETLFSVIVVRLDTKKHTDTTTPLCNNVSVPLSPVNFIFAIRRLWSLDPIHKRSAACPSLSGRCLPLFLLTYVGVFRSFDSFRN